MTCGRSTGSPRRFDLFSLRPLRSVVLRPLRSVVMAGRVSALWNDTVPRRMAGTSPVLTVRTHLVLRCSCFAARAHRFLPMLPVEQTGPQRRDVDALEAAGIHADPVWERSRRIEGMDA